MTKSYLFFLLAFLLTAFVSTKAFAQKATAARPAAAPSKFSLSSEENTWRLEPILGFQTVYRDSPTAHTVNQTIFGGRLVYGQQILAGELEYAQGRSTENFSTAPQKVVIKSEQLKLGVRSTLPFLDYFSLTGRAGGQATRGTVDQTSNGVTTSEDIAMKIYPYAGATLGLHLSRFLTLSAGTVVVFRNGLDMSKNDIQNYVSFSVGI